MKLVVVDWIVVSALIAAAILWPSWQSHALNIALGWSLVNVVLILVRTRR